MLLLDELLTAAVVVVDVLRGGRLESGSCSLPPFTEGFSVGTLPLAFCDCVNRDEVSLTASELFGRRATSSCAAAATLELLPLLLVATPFLIPLTS